MWQSDPLHPVDMAGGHISCGDFHGDDKSGSAISGVFEALSGNVSEANREDFISQVLTPLAAYLEENEDHYLIESDVAQQLIEPVAELYAQYCSELGHPEPFDAPQIDEDRGLKATDAKWGKGIGWRFYCLHDLKQALRASVESGMPVVVHFD